VDVVFQDYVSRDKLVDVFPNQSMEKMGVGKYRSEEGAMEANTYVLEV
jgi:hypothetical protein